MRIIGWVRNLRTAEVSSWRSSSLFGARSGTDHPSGLDLHLAALLPILQPPLRFFLKECQREGLPLTFRFEKEGACYLWTIAIDTAPVSNFASDSGEQIESLPDIGPEEDPAPVACAVASLLPGGTVILQPWGVTPAGGAPGPVPTYSVQGLTEIDVHRWLKNCASKVRQQLSAH